MFSLKTSIRRTISVVMAGVVATTIFTGCSTNNTSSSDAINSNTSSIVDTVGGYDKDFGMLFKYWYDGEIAQKTQQLAATVTDAAISTGKYFLDLEAFPIYADKGGNEYVVSGRTSIYLVDGKMATKDIFSYMRDSEGHRYYASLNSVDDAAALVDSFNAKLLAEGASQPTTIEERMASEDGSVVITSGKDYAVYVNNIPTNSIYNSNDMKPCITTILKPFALGTYVTKTNTMRLFTACGSVDITMTQNVDSYSLKYSTGEEYNNVPFSSIEVHGEEVYMTLDAIQKYLGYQVEVYSDSINIITDNKDIITANCVLPEGFMSSATTTTNPYDTSKPIDTTTPPVSSSTESSSNSEPTNSDTNSSSNSEPTNSSSNSTPSSSSSSSTNSSPSSSSSSSTSSTTTTKPTEKPSSSSGTGAISPITGKPITITIPVGTPGEYFDQYGNPMPDNFDPSKGGYYDRDGSYHLTPEEQAAKLRALQEAHDKIQNGTYGDDSSMSKEDRDHLDSLLGI